MRNSRDVKRSEEKMCKKIQELNGLNVNEILNQYWTRNTVPVDIAEILYKMDVQVHKFDFSEIEDKLNVSNGEILGAVIAKDDKLAIMYKEGETLHRTRFTLAHELAHCCLEHIQPSQKRYIEFRTKHNCSSTKEEIAANIFAGELLIPEQELAIILQQYFPKTFPFSEVLARFFMVSTNVMEERLKHLKIPFIDRENRKIICLT